MTKVRVTVKKLHVRSGSSFYTCSKGCVREGEIYFAGTKAGQWWYIPKLKGWISSLGVEVIK